MSSDRSDMVSNLEFNHYYQLNSVPETMLSIENKNSNSTISAAANTHTSEKGIIIALGFITTLLCLSGMQLYRSVNINPTQVKTTKRSRAFTLNNKNSIEEMSLEESDSFASFDKIEMSTIQNAVSHGKF